MGGRAKIFQFFPSENINRNEMHFGMSVLARLGSTHFHDFAGAAFNHNKTVLPQGRALHWIGCGSASISAIEGVLMLSTRLLVEIFGSMPAQSASCERRVSCFGRGDVSNQPGHRPP